MGIDEKNDILDPIYTINKNKKKMKIFEKLKNNSKKRDENVTFFEKDENTFVDVDCLLANGYTEIPKSKIDSVINDLGRDYPYITWSINRCDIVKLDDIDCDTIIFAFKDKYNNGIYRNDDLKLFFSYRNTISLTDIRNKISTLVK